MKNQTPTEARDTSEQPRNFLDRLIYQFGNLLSILFIFTVAISFYEVVMRYAFNAPTIWVHETASFIGGCLFVYGGIYALSTNKHVRVVLIYDLVSDRTPPMAECVPSCYGTYFLSTNELGRLSNGARLLV